MEYKKNPLTYEEQADLLISRGLSANRDTLIETLKNINYYRLSGYLYPFRNADDSFRKGTSLDIIRRRYRFDRQLRFLLLDAIERVEVALRSRLAYYFVHKYGAFEYLDKKHLLNLNQEQYDDFKQKLTLEISRSKEAFVCHFNRKYGDKHDMPPLWIACELFSFGLFLTFYRGIEKSMQQQLAKDLGVPDVALFSWLLALNNLRNLCAHHGRVYNRDFKIKLPTNTQKYPAWFNPFPIAGKKLFTVLTVLKYLLSHVAAQSRWHVRLDSLIKEYKDIPLAVMGFPDNWQRSMFWKEFSQKESENVHGAV